MKLIVGTQFTNDFGTYEVIEDNGWDAVTIKFIATGFTYSTRRDHVRNGVTRDHLVPIVCGIGFLGDGQYSSVTHNKEYKQWQHMLSRCYLPTDKEYTRYGGKGITVCPSWHNFQNFASWIIKQNKPTHYQLDKDIKIKGNLIYSPDTCLLVTPQQNAQEANAKSAAFISPQGEIFYTDNISKFAREHNLSQSCLSALYTKKRKKHKGWELYDSCLC